MAFCLLADCHSRWLDVWLMGVSFLLPFLDSFQWLDGLLVFVSLVEVDLVYLHICLVMIVVFFVEGEGFWGF